MFDLLRVTNGLLGHGRTNEATCTPGILAHDVHTGQTGRGFFFSDLLAHGCHLQLVRNVHFAFGQETVLFNLMTAMD